MDKFEQKIQEIMGLSESDRDSAVVEFKNSCICPTCATYNECAREVNEKLFCVTGESIKCITDLKGCECPTCPLAQSLDVGIINNAYCLRGSEIEQREK